MKIIEPHIHMVSRTTDDYQSLSLAGIHTITEPAFWAGFDRGNVEGFRDYFEQLTVAEPIRAAKFGVAHYSWICLNPKESLSQQKVFSFLSADYTDLRRLIIIYKSLMF